MPSISRRPIRREARSRSRRGRSARGSRSNFWSRRRGRTMRYDFMILDVFTAKPFGGNQLAVLTDARGLTGEAMQAIAREFNFPESTFVLPADDPAHARRVRIFAPAVEFPFAGHPTVGTACALAMAGEVPVGDIVLEEGV